MSLFPTTSTLICFELAKCFVNRNIHPSSIQNFKSPQTGKLKKSYKFLKGKEERREIKIVRILSYTHLPDVISRLKLEEIPSKDSIHAAYRSVVNVTQLHGVKITPRAGKIDDPGTESRRASSSRMSLEVRWIEGD